VVAAQEKIKVLQVNKLYPPVIGGVEKITQQIAEGLAGCTDMKVLVCRAQGRTLKEQINGAEIYQAGSMGIAFSVPLSLRFFSLFRQLIPDRDILQIHMPFPLADLALLLFRFQGKVALWWHSDIVRQRKLLAVYRPLLKRTLDRADVVITATQGNIDGSEFLPAYREKCVIVPYGVNENLLAAGEKAQQTYQARQAEATAKANPPVTFLFIGRLVYYKGCDILLDAFAKVHGARLILIGSGPLEHTLKAKTNRLGLAAQVEFRGYSEDETIAQALAACDVFVLPSIAKTEAFGLVQLEAMAYGKPVINTRLPGGVPHVSLDKITGLTVPPGNPDALAEAMQTLADNPTLRQQFGQAAYRRVREEFRLDHMLDQVYAIYKRLLPG
jgi:rhamnosyl/mannosyltransferase